MQKRMVMGMVLSACLLTAGIGWANEESVGLAAADPQQVAALIGDMDAATVPAFAGDVVGAIASMPLSPVLRLRQMRDATAAFLQATPAAELPSLLARMLGAVPFEMLPRWADAVKPTLLEHTAEMSADDFKKLGTDVVQALGQLEDASDEAKTIYTTFAVVLLNRGESSQEQDELAALLLAAVPAAYHDQVEAALAPALQGDYTMLLGPDALRIVEPHEKMGARRVLAADASGHVPEDAGRLIHDINRPAPLILRPRAGEAVPPPSPTGQGAVSSSSPVIPPPYVGQF